MILISGGAGFLGLNTARQLARDGHSVVITTRRRDDKVSEGVAAGSDGRITVEVVDLSNSYAVVNLFSRYDFERVIHTATAHMFANSRAANFPSYQMLFNMLEAATSAGVKHFVMASSLAIYRGVKAPYREDAPLPPEIDVKPDSSMSFIPDFEVTLKRTMEALTLDYGLPMASWDRAPKIGSKARQDQMQTAVVRYPAQVGPFYSSMYNPIAGLVHAYAKNNPALSSRPLHPFVDISYILDNADSLKTVALADTRPHRIYNASSDIHATARDVLEAFYRVAPNAPEPRLKVEDQADEHLDQYFDITRLREDFGWKPRFTLDSMLADYVAWVRKNPF
jgi:nucleoside-diphosphate-sugar epimerase